MPFTQVDNTIIDHLQGLSSRELKVLLCIQRQTRGWNRLSAFIPPSRFAKLTGIREDHCIQSLNTMEKQGKVHRIKEDKEYRYFPSANAKIGHLKRKKLFL